MKVIISACLCGKPCRYNGSHCLDRQVIEFAEKNDVILVCPEILGGLCTPRLPCEIVNDQDSRKVINALGEDKTDAYIHGAGRVCEIAKQNGITTAILKSKSPSCGSGLIYDGSFTNKLIEGDGIASLFLKAMDIDVLNETEIERLLY